MAGRQGRRPPRAVRRIRSKAEYAAALARLEWLQGQPLGTPATEGLQALAEAILEYEERTAARRARNGVAKEGNP